MKIQDLSALVTGGASGLGRATAQRLAAAGAQVFVVDLPSSAGEKVATRLGNGATFVPADVTNEEQVASAVTIASRDVPLRIVVNCAGIGDPARTLGRHGPLDLKRFQKVISINLIGTFNVIRLAAKNIAESDPTEGERGVIVNTASVAAFDGQVGQASYSASKAGIVGMTLPIARDLSDSLIRVMTVAPGMFETPILQGLSAEARASLEAQIPHPSRLGDPGEFGMLVQHIVENPMLNGETIRLDGAIRMAPR